MITIEGIDSMAKSLADAGYPEDWAGLIGDCPLLDDGGEIMVLDHDENLIATIPASVLGYGSPA